MHHFLKRWGLHELCVRIVEVLWFHLLAVRTVRVVDIVHEQKDPPLGGSFCSKCPSIGNFGPSLSL